MSLSTRKRESNFHQTGRFSAALQDFILGAKSPLRAARLLSRTPALAALALVPMALTVLLYMFLDRGLVAPAAESLSIWIVNAFSSLPLIGKINFLVHLINVAVAVLVRLVFWMLAALLFAICSNIIAMPFNDFLAARTELHCDPQLEVVQSRGWLSELKKLAIDLLKSLLATLLLLPLLFLSLVPIANLLALIGIWLLLSFQYLSYPQTRREMTVARSIKQIRKHFWICLGLGWITWLGFSIPLLGILIAPLSVVAGTLVFSEMQSRDTNV